jgi:hypothetical protein
VGAILLLGALFFAVAALVPSRYVAVARVLTPPLPFDASALAVRAATQDISVSGERGSRVLSLEHTATEPRAAAAQLNGFLERGLSGEIVVIDRAGVPFRPLGPGRALLWGMALLLACSGLLLLRRRRAVSLADRALVRLAITVAKLGNRALLIDTGGKFRLVLSREVSAGLQFEIIGQRGTLVLGRLSPAGDARLPKLS